MVLPFEQVRLEAEDVEDAYRQQRNALPDHSANAHTELARWCLTNGLKDQAVKELREAVRREPGSLTAKNMLQRVNDQLLATNALPTVTPKKNGQYSLLGDAKPLATVEALGGLSRESASDFVSKVQPLLVNRCATAGCHGPGSGNGFELQRVRLGKGSPKAASERNLAAVLEQIDRDRLMGSPLLTKLRGESKADGLKQSHGGLSREQMQVLRNWITALGRNTETATSPIAATKRSVVETSPDLEVDSPAETDPSPPDKAIRLKTIRADAADPETDVDDKSFRQLLRKSDPFDPEEFNKSE